MLSKAGLAAEIIIDSDRPFISSPCVGARPHLLVLTIVLQLYHLNEEAVTICKILQIVNRRLRMILILVIVIGLVAWALHLMQRAIEDHEFSLMLAGFLVSSAAAAMMAVYFLMGHYVGYMTEMSQRVHLMQDSPELEWMMPLDAQSPSSASWAEVSSLLHNM
jgi:hypothetical protein